ncbi:MAG: hypothetical protein [Olavius algarvensis Gamma 1 endosymbiont]|nr:MAG: hypothetical protein [Olavius algarvensis Gamma 1 endosymbiont]
MLPLGAKGVLCGHGFPFAGLKYELFSVTALAAGNARRIRTRPAMGTCLSCSFVVPVQIFSITETLSRQDSTENLAANQPLPAREARSARRVVRGRRRRERLAEVVKGP